MKKVLLALTVIVSMYNTKAQYLQTDSLTGFDLPGTVIQAYQMNLTKEELKPYVKRAQRAYINEKFHLTPAPRRTISSSKYNFNFINNLPCNSEDFEPYPVGTVTLSYGWAVSQCTSTCRPVCNSNTMTMSANLTAVAVYSTPITDPIFGAVGISPFGGNKIAKINDLGNQVGRIRQTFPVMAAFNPLFHYAYKGVLSDNSHTNCCNDAYLMFRFYDASGNVISSLSHTVTMATAGCITTSTANWAATTSSLGSHYTPNWQIFTVNLSAYNGSSITAEVIASPCDAGSHLGYMYYDAICSNGAIIANGEKYMSPATAYTSCAATATLAGMPGYTSYLWQGPPSSGVSGFTGSVVTTAVSGNYTLSASLGTISSTQTLNLTVTPATSPVIIGTGSICIGQAATLQISGNGINTYSWNTGASQPVISVSPAVTTTYSAIVSNTLGCISKIGHTLTVLPLPVMSITSTTPYICIGQGLTLLANASGAGSYSWSTGSSNPIISVSPVATTVYTLTGLSPFGCQSSTTKTIDVYPLPQLQLSQSSLSLCLGQSSVLTATGIPGNTYYWSTGTTASSIIVSPSVTSIYNVVATTTAGCSASGSGTIAVHPLPQIQLTASQGEICLGQSASFVILGSNIASVLWNTGASSLSISVTPTLNTVYSVTVTSALGCTAGQSQSLIVNSLPQVHIVSSGSAICAGESATLSAIGTSITAYQWSGGQAASSIVVSPAATSQYSLTVTDVKGCSSSSSLWLVVNPLPQAQILSTSPAICTGESATVSVNGQGISTYQWTTGQTTSSIVVSPSVTTQYSVIVTDFNSCSSSTAFHLQVSECTGIQDNQIERKKLMIVPNPSDGTFEIIGHEKGKGWLVNDLGQIMREIYLSSDNNYTSRITGLAKGIYFVMGWDSSEKIIIK